MERFICTGERMVYIGFGNVCGFRLPPGVSGHIPYGQGGLLYFQGNHDQIKFICSLCETLFLNVEGKFSLFNPRSWRSWRLSRPLSPSAAGILTRPGIRWTALSPRISSLQNFPQHFSLLLPYLALFLTGKVKRWTRCF